MLKGRILSVDFGLKRIGLAVSDPLQVIASPLENLEAGRSPKASAERLVKHLETLKEKGYRIEAIVIGLPLHMSGKESERSQLVRQFKECVEALSALPVELFDERLSSIQAERALIETGFSRKKRSEVVDRVSAQIVLQTYLAQRGPR